jgi:hypothetical protein
LDRLLTPPNDAGFRDFFLSQLTTRVLGNEYKFDPAKMPELAQGIAKAAQAIREGKAPEKELSMVADANSLRLLAISYLRAAEQVGGACENGMKMPTQESAKYMMVAQALLDLSVAKSSAAEANVRKTKIDEWGKCVTETQNKELQRFMILRAMLNHEYTCDKTMWMDGTILGISRFLSPVINIKEGEEKYQKIAESYSGLEDGIAVLLQNAMLGAATCDPMEGFDGGGGGYWKPRKKGDPVRRTTSEPVDDGGFGVQVPK